MTHEFDGKKYEKASTHQREWGASLAAELVLQGKERVLDLGCGDGVNTALLADCLPHGHVIGIDASQGMIDAAKPKERENLQFFLLDIDALDFDREFDLIYSNAALHWVKDHHRLLDNVRKALCPEGVVRFNFAADGNCANFLRVIDKAMKQQAFVDCFTDFSWPWYMPSLVEYQTLVQAVGFKEVRVWGENADRYFPGTDAMVAWLDQPSLVPFLAHVPESHAAEFRAYVVREMIALTKKENGQCFESFRRMNLWARL